MLNLKSLPILAGAALAVFVLGQPASATPVTLTLTGPISGNTVGPQSTSNPCIIAGTNCQQPAFMGFNNFTSSGGISSYNMFSTTPTANVADGVQGTPYTVAQLLIADTIGQKKFDVAIDVNTTGAKSETLQLFEVIVNGAVAYNFVGPTNIGNVFNNGNGFGDWTLGVVDLSPFQPTDTVLFHAVWNNAVDGAESYFLISVPAPSIGHGLAIGLLTGGLLLGIGLWGRNRNDAAADPGLPHAA